MRKSILTILALLFKGLLFYWIGIVLGLGSFDPESSLLNQSWKVYLFLYLPLLVGTERFMILLIESITESKT